MLDFEKIFLGHTPSEQRKYMSYLLQKTASNFRQIIVPAVGEFTIPKIAILAGFKKENIYTSDISLFSSLLGCLFSNQPIEKLGYILSPEYQVEYDAYEDDISRSAYLYWLMKMKQIPDKTYFTKMHQDNLKAEKVKYIEQIRGKLEKYINFYRGLHYEIKDLREVICQQWDAETMLIINPPAFSKGYSRMFDFGEDLSFDAGIEEFNWSKEYCALYEISRQSEAVFLWYRYQNTDGLPAKDVLFAKEYTSVRFDYWLCTKPEKIIEMGVKRNVNFKKATPCKGLKVKIVPSEYQITNKTKMSFRQVSQDVALYYRDLWAHKLGSTKAESYFLMLLDGMVFGTVGFHLKECRSLSSDEIFECYGFTAPLTDFSTSNRLLMLAITAKEFQQYLYYQVSKRNRLLRIERFKTTCLSKYRKVKLNNGILRIRDREKMKNGMYKIVYVTDFYDRTYSDCVNIFLEELTKGRK